MINCEKISNSAIAGEEDVYYTTQTHDLHNLIFVCRHPPTCISLIPVQIIVGRKLYSVTKSYYNCAISLDIPGLFEHTGSFEFFECLQTSLPHRWLLIHVQINVFLRVYIVFILYFAFCVVLCESNEGCRL